MSTPTEPLNVRVSSGFKDKLDDAAESAGFGNRSEFVREALRTAIAEELSPDEYLSATALEKIEESRSQFREEKQAADESRTDQLLDEHDAVTHLHRAAADADESQSSTAIIGCGGVGIKILNQIINQQPEGLDTFAFDSDKSDIIQSKAGTPVRVGQSEIDELKNPLKFSTEDTPQRVEKLREAFYSTITGGHEPPPDYAFVVTGIGGKTGTFLAPHIANVLDNHGSTVVVIGSLPFNVEGQKLRRARLGANALNEEADTLVLLDGTNEVTSHTNTRYGPALKQMNTKIANTVLQFSTNLVDRAFESTNEDVSATSLLEEGQLAILVENQLSLDEMDPDSLLLDSDYSSVALTAENSRAAILNVRVGTEIPPEDIRPLIKIIEEEYSLTGVAWHPVRDESLNPTDIHWSGIVTGIGNDPQEIIPDPSVGLDYEVVEPHYPICELENQAMRHALMAHAPPSLAEDQLYGVQYQLPYSWGSEFSDVRLGHGEEPWFEWLSSYPR